MKAISALLGHFCYANSLVCKFWLSSLINYLFAGQAGSPPPGSLGGAGSAWGGGGGRRAGLSSICPVLGSVGACLWGDSARTGPERLGGLPSPASRAPPHPAGGGRCSFPSSFVLKAEPPASGDGTHDLHRVGAPRWAPLEGRPSPAGGDVGDTRQPPILVLPVRTSRFTIPAAGIGHESAPNPGACAGHGATLPLCPPSWRPVPSSGGQESGLAGSGAW